MPLVLYSGFVPDFMRQNNSPLNRAHSIALGQQVAPGKRECGGVSEQESTVIASRIFRPFSWSKSSTIVKRRFSGCFAAVPKT
jgi:hypothetical protein